MLCVTNLIGSTKSLAPIPIILILSLSLNIYFLSSYVLHNYIMSVRVNLDFMSLPTDQYHNINEPSKWTDYNYDLYDKEEMKVFRHRNLDDIKQLPLSKIGEKVNMTSFQDLKVHLIFFAFLSPDRNWWYSLESYVKHILDTGLLNRADSLHVCISTPTNKDFMTDFSTKEPPSDHIEAQLRLRNATAIFERGFWNYSSIVHYDVTLGNVFEFPGLIKMWTLASQVPDEETAHKSVYLYFHAKGIAMHGQLNPGIQGFSHYFYNVVGQWKYALREFANDKNMKTACTDSSDAGYCFGNHMWVRGTHLRTLRRPKRANSRYYYEHWLSHIDKHPIFPINYTLNFDFVQFNESYNENWRWVGYENGVRDNLWEINPKYKYGHRLPYEDAWP